MAGIIQLPLGAWSGGQLPQYKTQHFGHEIVHQTFSDLSTGLLLQSPHG